MMSFPVGCLVLTKDGIGRVKAFTDPKYTVVVAGEVFTTKKVKSVKTKTAVTLQFDADSETPMLNMQAASVTKYVGDGKYQCLLLTVVPGHPGGYLTVDSENLLPGCESESTRQKKRKREEEKAAAPIVPTTYTAPPRSTEQHEKDWADFLGKKHQSLQMSQIPWPDDPTQEEPAQRFALLEKQLSVDRDDLEGKVLRKLRLRWHPDRFVSKYCRLVPEGELREAVHERVAAVSAYINRDVETCGRWRMKKD